MKSKVSAENNTESQDFSEGGSDVVAAYDLLSRVYPAIAEAHKSHLDAIDDLIIQLLPSGSRSLLDVGAGDGRRANKVASWTGIRLWSSSNRAGV